MLDYFLDDAAPFCIAELAVAQEIAADIVSDYYVIKPRGGFRGSGVIIVAKEDLDETLQYILSDSTRLKKDRRKSHRYWIQDKFDSFIVEKYYPSDLVQVEAFVTFAAFVDYGAHANH